MRGLLEHFKLTLALNVKSRQALIYGYLVPIFFLIAFGSIFRDSSPPLLRQLGQLLTISVLGGACFGMPTAMVAERERGVWRRYRLLPAATGSLVITTMVARFLIVLSAAVMQILLAALMYGMPMPVHPFQMIVAFAVVTFAFLGMGLVIAMLADAVPAVQALGQMIFLPMIIIGGVGVPLWTLPLWAQHLAGFLPGKYAVKALDDCATGMGLGNSTFDLLALLAIGAAACTAGAMMFRWDAQERTDPRRRWWVFLTLFMWISVGFAAEVTHRGPAAPAKPVAEEYASLTRAEIDAITFNDLPDDTSTVTPVAKNLDGLDEEGKKRIAEFRQQLAEWPPALVPSLTRRVRNLLDVASIADITIDPYEGADAYVVFEQIKAGVPREDLEKVLAWITLHPADTQTITKAPELGIKGEARPLPIQERVEVYAAKLLGRVDGKIK